MQKFYLIIFFFLCYKPSIAQVNISKNDIIKAGTIVIEAIDDTTRPVIALPGAGRRWDFSFLQRNQTDTLKFGNPDWFEGHDTFAGSTLAYSGTLNKTTRFLELDNDALFETGTLRSMFDTLIPFLSKRKLLSLPSTYNSTYNDNTESATGAMYLGFDFDDSGSMPFIDSIRTTVRTTVSSICNGYGTLITPADSFSCIMQSVTEITSYDPELFIDGSWQAPSGELADIFGNGNGGDTSNRHVWWNKSGYPVMQYTYNADKGTAEDVQWVYKAPQLSSLSEINTASLILYPNPSSESVILKNNTEFSSVSFSDMSGKTIYRIEHYDGITPIPVSNLETGIYLVRAYNRKTNTISQTRFIKN